MGAHDNATVTIDTGEMTYTDRNGNTHAVNNEESFVMLLAAQGSSEKYTFQAGGQLALATGEKLKIEADPLLSQFVVDTDATAKLNAGSIWFVEEDNSRNEWRIRTITIDDIDEPTSLTATLERADDPMITMTLSAVTVSQ